MDPIYIRYYFTISPIRSWSYLNLPDSGFIFNIFLYKYYKVNY